MGFEHKDCLKKKVFVCMRIAQITQICKLGHDHPPQKSAKIL